MQGFIQVPGGRVAYWLYGEDTPGVPLLCVHGGPGMPHDYLEPLTQLCQDRPIVFYDQLGCGASDPIEDVSKLTVSHFVQELEVVRRELGLQKFHLLGHSWGGWLALQYVVDYKPRIRSLSICGSPASSEEFVLGCDELKCQLPGWMQDAILECEHQEDFRDPSYVAATNEFYRRHFCRLEPWPEPVKRSMDNLNLDIYLHMWGPSEFGPVTGVLRDWSIEGRLAEISVPSFIACGVWDEARPKYMSKFCANLSGPVEFHIFENSSHLPFWEDRDAFHRALRAFLRKYDKTTV
ncbi:proline iminopeptidase-family hydrolase [Alicyclobacillus acidocaldarius]|uniref:Proline iminopeptidase n=1 Tax=Alicyclobacillus acidocaldarius subsp. acidocaldarius (strain ATCC 27009 / DSM 446 / BCRC 14685 / JCM 5260 / KCTC 1825 / NBRC 15652 / NCIMB 11725 / NRRL B-14509 / 104-IA) TaxID=521098 RepID=C8WT11_ALIAD|nr:proline-specific peptidase [Alicyclobacillus acidocaldarius subsp. acidocaldarius DSM 446]